MRNTREYMAALMLAVLVPWFCGGCTKQLSLPSAAVSSGPVAPSSTYNGQTPAESDCQLGANLYNFYENQSAGSSGNIFFSPFSIITCMAMAQEGAVGPTQTQMQNVLGLNPNTTARLQGFQQLLSQINAPSKPYTLSTADNLWPQQLLPVLPSFENNLQTYYGAGVTQLNYGNPDGAAQTIDGAVSQETDGYIPNLLTSGDVANAELVLTNAIYFQADWQSQFVTTGTRPQTFTLTTGSTEPVTMMHQTLTSAIGNYNGAASVLALPYKDNGASMYIFLPPLGGMATLESRMTGPNINAWLAANSSAMSGSSFGQVALSLPKFKFSTQYQLASTLSAMGMPLAFTKPGPNGSGANFSGIDGNVGLYISKVIHEAYIDVNESGTTAAAATAVVMTISISMVGPPPPPPIPFTADHPFIFMIVDNANQTVLFMGRVNDPNQGS